MARKSTAFSKTQLLAPHRYNHCTSWLRLASQVHGLVTFFNISIFPFFNISFLEPCLYFSIALMQIKPFPSRSQPCLFKSRVHPCLKIPHSSHVLFPHVSDFLFYSLKFSGATSEIPTLLYYLCIQNKIPIPLNHWIRTNTELSARLAATGYISTQRRFTPQQVNL